MDIALEQPVTLQHTSDDEARFTVGAADARIALSTGSGGIKIRNSD